MTTVFHQSNVSKKLRSIYKEFVKSLHVCLMWTAGLIHSDAIKAMFFSERQNSSSSLAYSLDHRTTISNYDSQFVLESSTHLLWDDMYPTASQQSVPGLFTTEQLYQITILSLYWNHLPTSFGMTCTQLLLNNQYLAYSPQNNCIKLLFSIWTGIIYPPPLGWHVPNCFSTISTWPIHHRTTVSNYYSQFVQESSTHLLWDDMYPTASQQSVPGLFTTEQLYQITILSLYWNHLPTSFGMTCTQLLLNNQYLAYSPQNNCIKLLFSICTGIIYPPPLGWHVPNCFSTISTWPIHHRTTVSNYYSQFVLESSTHLLWDDMYPTASQQSVPGLFTTEQLYQITILSLYWNHLPTSFGMTCTQLLLNNQYLAYSPQNNCIKLLFSVCTGIIYPPPLGWHVPNWIIYPPPLGWHVPNCFSTISTWPIHHRTTVSNYYSQFVQESSTHLLWDDMYPTASQQSVPGLFTTEQLYQITILSLYWNHLPTSFGMTCTQLLLNNQYLAYSPQNNCIKLLFSVCTGIIYPPPLGWHVPNCFSTISTWPIHHRTTVSNYYSQFVLESSTHLLWDDMYPTASQQSVPGLFTTEQLYQITILSLYRNHLPTSFGMTCTQLLLNNQYLAYSPQNNCIKLLFSVCTGIIYPPPLGWHVPNCFSTISTWPIHHRTTVSNYYSQFVLESSTHLLWDDMYPTASQQSVPGLFTTEQLYQITILSLYWNHLPTSFGMTCTQLLLNNQYLAYSPQNNCIKLLFSVCTGIIYPPPLGWHVSNCFSLDRNHLPTSFGMTCTQLLLNNQYLAYSPQNNCIKLLFSVWTGIIYPPPLGWHVPNCFSTISTWPIHHRTTVSNYYSQFVLESSTHLLWDDMYPTASQQSVPGLFTTEQLYQITILNLDRNHLPTSFGMTCTQLLLNNQYLAYSPQNNCIKYQITILNLDRNHLPTSFGMTCTQLLLNNQYLAYSPQNNCIKLLFSVCTGIIYPPPLGWHVPNCFSTISTWPIHHRTTVSNYYSQFVLESSTHLLWDDMYPTASQQSVPGLFTTEQLYQITILSLYWNHLPTSFGMTCTQLLLNNHQYLAYSPQNTTNHIKLLFSIWTGIIYPPPLGWHVPNCFSTISTWPIHHRTTVSNYYSQFVLESSTHLLWDDMYPTASQQSVPGLFTTEQLYQITILSLYRNHLPTSFGMTCTQLLLNNQYLAYSPQNNCIKYQITILNLDRNHLPTSFGMTCTQLLLNNQYLAYSLQNNRIKLLFSICTGIIYPPPLGWHVSNCFSTISTWPIHHRTTVSNYYSQFGQESSTHSLLLFSLDKK